MGATTFSKKSGSLLPKKNKSGTHFAENIDAY